MLADDLLEDARHLANRGSTENRESCRRRAIATAYYAVFHLLIADFIACWPYEDQRARIGRMFKHKDMREAAFSPKDRKNPSPVEADLIDVIGTFGELQNSRHMADYDIGWNVLDTDAADSVALADDAFGKWRRIRDEPVARQHLLTMFGAKR